MEVEVSSSSFPPIMYHTLTVSSPVDGAIHSAAGHGLYQECRNLNGAETGESKITGGHRLPSKHVIHTVGPIYAKSRKEQCEAQLRSCYKNTFRVAVENGCKSLVGLSFFSR